MMKHIVILFCKISIGFLIISVPLSAMQDEFQSDEQRYAKCLDMTEKAPDNAVNEALIWKGQGGGVPARHCEALGLFYLGEHEEAAVRLERLVDDMRVGRDMPVRLGKRIVANAFLLAEIYNQAANAWLVAGEIVRAEEAIDNALSLTTENSPQEREFLIDRARIAAADDNFEQAYTDLKAVSAADPGRIDIMLLLASAARGTDRLDEASQALSIYQKVYPDDPSAYLEYGNLKHAQNDFDAARQAWLKVLLLQGDGANADAARSNLEALDLNVDKNP
ncbi:lipopolysaccharide assembly protein LapB [Kordiimonas sp. SCSIO 12610]|uniref:tetratricopeptide repeat protein n=1 Tax=Kordiimonas sp. SCSIO 12610 TaxID=2829597 RepID=UPI00210F008F|nr:hypothetical protein [Kordiimonas sp. SCSIO 12610]UTW55512.1 hypothetical protein KFF44_01055 [Kordiimonas sp. SCSIO 12610]